MTVIEVASASAPTALTLNTPSTLTTETTPGVYQLVIDAANLSGGDILVVRSRIIIVSGGSTLLLEEEVLAGVLGPKAWMTEPIGITQSVSYELEQTAGTGRVIPWAVLRS